MPLILGTVETGELDAMLFCVSVFRYNIPFICVLLPMVTFVPSSDIELSVALSDDENFNIVPVVPEIDPDPPGPVGP